MIENVDAFITNETKYITEYLRWDASISQEEQQIESEEIVAKVILNTDTKENRCFIKTAKGFLYNPFMSRHNVKNRYINIHWKWREVDKDTLQQYIEFIKTKNEVHYKHAERMKFRNGV